LDKPAENGNTSPLSELVKCRENPHVGSRQAEPARAHTIVTLRRTMNGVTERRKHPRFRARKGSFAALGSVKALGQINDISNDGLAFTHLAEEELLEEPLELEIFSPTDNFYLRKVPCKFISNIRIEAGFSLTPVTTQRCCLQFKKLSEEQKLQLDFFLRNYTVGYA
jgi:hypothetical protein